MKVRFLKEHGFNKTGDEADLTDAAANYLIRVGAAVGVIYEGEKEEAAYEKAEVTPAKEKKENKTGNVPTAKKKKK